MTEHEKEALKRKAAKNGMTVSEYARTLLANSDDATIRVIDTEPLRKAARDLAKQGTNLNQFMKFLKSYNYYNFTNPCVKLFCLFIVKTLYTNAYGSPKVQF